MLCTGREEKLGLGLRDRTEMEGKVEDVLQLFPTHYFHRSLKHAMAEACFYSKEADWSVALLRDQS